MKYFIVLYMVPLVVILVYALYLKLTLTDSDYARLNVKDLLRFSPVPVLNLLILIFLISTLIVLAVEKAYKLIMLLNK